MDYTLYQKVKVITGIGCVKKIGQILKEGDYKKAFLVYGKSAKKNGVIDEIIKSLNENGIKYYEFDKVVPNPSERIVDEGSKICNKECCDIVVGIGGGSAIDTAKGINLLRFNEGRILDYLSKTPISCKGFVAIPTTSGTGSELSQGAVISDDKTEKKFIVFTDCFTDEYAILDSGLTCSMPKELTVISGLDTFSHAAEAYTSVRANTITDLLCEKIMETVVEYLPIVVNCPSNIIARDKMLNAASLGGWVLICSSDHIGHGLAHVVGSKYHIVHGAACAYTIPGMFRFLADKESEKIKNIGKILGEKFTGTEIDMEIGNKTANAYIKFRDDVLGLKSIKEYNIDKRTIEESAKEVLKEDLCNSSPKKATLEDVIKILNDSIDC